MANEVKEPAFKYNYITPAEYLLAERASEEKHEYYDGQVLVMSGASLRHNKIEVNLITSIGSFLNKKDCHILPGNMRVSTPAQDAYMYPDAVIFCGTENLEDDVFDTLLNPSVIFEILSPQQEALTKEGSSFFISKFPPCRNTS